MKRYEVEIAHRCRRGVECVMLCGDRRINDAEGQQLLSEYRTEYRRDIPVVYFSRDGWQPLIEVRDARIEAEPTPSLDPVPAHDPAHRRAKVK